MSLSPVFLKLGQPISFKLLPEVLSSQFSNPSYCSNWSYDRLNLLTRFALYIHDCFHSFQLIVFHLWSGRIWPYLQYAEGYRLFNRLPHFSISVFVFNGPEHAEIALYIFQKKTFHLPFAWQWTVSSTADWSTPCSTSAWIWELS